MTGSPKETRKVRTPLGAAVRGFVLVIFDVAIFNQGAISVVVGIWSIFVSLPIVVLSKRHEGRRRAGLAVVGIYVATVIIVLISNSILNNIAQNRAETLVATIEAYREDHGAYPPALSALVPTYLDEIPKAKPVGSGKFRYTNSGDVTVLMYTDLPPFGRPYYDFNERFWGYMD